MSDVGGRKIDNGEHRAESRQEADGADPSSDLRPPTSAIRPPSSDLRPPTSYPPVSPLLAGLLCRCPGCGKGRLFRGFLGLPERCDVCGLDYAFIDAGDGPAVFIIFFSGFIVVGSALIVEAMYQPPFWLHALLWGPLILLTTIGPLRPMKALLVALQYHHKAAEGRLERKPGP